ncbi:MAG: hypothetical protein HYZ08_02000 [Candidatus Kerfeldbacteria bacterium]|nr:hypothetical protein [Candidatus Kerfeldbacteria bacterium]
MLDQQDLQQIGTIVDRSIDRAITNLVETVLKPSFDDVYRRLDGHDERFDEMDARLKRVESNMVTKYFFADRIATLQEQWDLKWGRHLRASA